MADEDTARALERLAREQQAERRRRARAISVRRHMSLPRLPRVRGVWVVALVRNEADIIERTLTHAFDQGVAHALVADNGSTDETPQILREMAKHYPLSVARDGFVAHEQALKTTHLARVAAHHGATWVVPMDADEFWSATDSGLADYLAASEADVEVAEVYNVFPVSDIAEVSLSDTVRFDLTPSPSVKVAVRAHRLMRIRVGNHSATSGRSVNRQGGLRVTHLPWRSQDQLSRKVVQGVAAVELTDEGPGAFYHWRMLARHDRTELDKLWAGILRGECSIDIGWSPVGPFRLGTLKELL